MADPSGPPSVNLASNLMPGVPLLGDATAWPAGDQPVNRGVTAGAVATVVDVAVVGVVGVFAGRRLRIKGDGQRTIASLHARSEDDVRGAEGGSTATTTGVAVGLGRVAHAAATAVVATTAAAATIIVLAVTSTPPVPSAPDAPGSAPAGNVPPAPPAACVPPPPPSAPVSLPSVPSTPVTPPPSPPGSASIVTIAAAATGASGDDHTIVERRGAAPHVRGTATAATTVIALTARGKAAHRAAIETCGATRRFGTVAAGAADVDREHFAGSDGDGARAEPPRPPSARASRVTDVARAALGVHAVTLTEHTSAGTVKDCAAPVYAKSCVVGAALAGDGSTAISAAAPNTPTADAPTDSIPSMYAHGPTLLGQRLPSADTKRPNSGLGRLDNQLEERTHQTKAGAGPSCIRWWCRSWGRRGSCRL